MHWQCEMRERPVPPGSLTGLTHGLLSVWKRTLVDLAWLQEVSYGLLRDGRLGTPDVRGALGSGRPAAVLGRVRTSDSGMSPFTPFSGD
jgi:hypothetical protein